MGMIGSSHSMVREKIGLQSNVMDVGNWVISGMNDQGNRQADPMLIVRLVYSEVLFCQCHHLMLIIWCQENNFGRGFPIAVQF